jgi:hypothetical protein
MGHSIYSTMETMAEASVSLLPPDFLAQGRLPLGDAITAAVFLPGVAALWAARQGASLRATSLGGTPLSQPPRTMPSWMRLALVDSASMD